jgi:UDP-N-acetylmuramoyl-tripeptide--D-alanyl-D-alanine ligase
MASRTRGTVHTFGQDLGAGTRLADITVDDLGRASFELLTSTEQVRVDLRLLGAHQAMNAAAVAAAAEAVGVGLEAVAGSLGRLTALSKWRMELHERADGLVVINDAYNANPDSMAAALTTLAGIGASSHRQTVAVLGEMRELGPASEAEHEAIGLLAADLGIDHLYVVGSGARAIGAGYPGAIFVASVAEVIDAVRKTVVGTDVVLIKASRAAGLERVAEALGEIERAKETGQ